MEIIEENFRKTPKNHQKYAKRLSDYIDILIKKGRLLEAKHFFNILYKDKGSNRTTIRLGYILAIRLFNPEEIKKFDLLLIESHATQIEIQEYQLKYYYSINNTLAIERCCEYLLSQKLDINQLTTIMEICINQKSYTITEKLIKYLNKHKITISKLGSKEIKSILIKKLVSTLTKHSKNA